MAKITIWGVRGCGRNRNRNRTTREFQCSGVGRASESIQSRFCSKNCVPAA